MKKQKVKRFWATLLAIGVVITTVFPGTTYADEIGTQISEPVKVEEQSDPVEDGEEQTDSEVKPAGDSNILLLSSETVPEDTLGAVAVEQLAGAVRLTYESAELSKNAFDAFTAMGIACEYDIQVEMLDKEPEKVEELNPAETPTEDVAVVEELKEEPVAVESASKEKSVKVAVVDTGCDLNVISGRIADGTDMSVTDVNGHGTLVAEIIASQTTEKVKILPIKAFDDNGYSTVGQVYDAIMRAIDLGADVINLSMSGAGTSQMLTHAINKATEKGIIVVAAAGNDASDVEGFMPGNIDSAITVSATDRNEVFAEYSNFGEKIDYSAVGEIIKDQGTEDTSDDVYYNGTSIAAAFVSSYAACIKDNNPEADVIGTFDKYAKDLGSAGRDDCYGRGFLTLENIKFDISKEEPDEKENTTKEKTESKPDKDKEQILKTTATITVNNATELRNAFAKANSEGAKVSVKLGKSFSVADICSVSNGSVTINGSYKASDGSTKKRTITISGSNNANGVGSTYFMKYEAFMQAKNGATLTLKNVTIDANNLLPNPNTGNAVVTATGGTVNISNCNFKNVESGHGKKKVTAGGINAIEAKTGTLVVKNTKITNSNATGGVCAWEGINNITCENVEIDGGTDGIGIAIAKQGNKKGNSVAAIKNCTIYNTTNGKGINISDDSPKISGSCTATIDSCKLYGNTIGINASSAKATINSAEIYDNGTGINVTSSSTVTLNPTTGSVVLGKRTNANTSSTQTHPNDVGIKNAGTLKILDNNIADANKVKICWNKEKGIHNTGTGNATVNYADIYNNGILSSHFIAGADSYDYNPSTNDCAGVYNNGELNMTGTSVTSNLRAGVWSGANSITGFSNVTISNNKGNGFINHGKAHIGSGNYFSNDSNGVSSDGNLTIDNGNYYSNGTSGVNSAGTLVVKSGCYRNNASHGVAIGGGTAGIEGGWFGTYYDSNKKTWVDAGNANSGVRTTNATTTVFGGVFAYNNIGLECQDETLTVKGNNIAVFSNDNYGLYIKGGTTTLSGGDIYGNKKYGVYNKGTFNMTGGKVRDNDSNGMATGGIKRRGISNEKGTANISGGTISGNSDGLYNVSKVNIIGGTISGNDNGIYNDTLNHASGTTTVNGANVNITGNTRGIQNTADENGVKVIKATITGNTTADLSQSGKTFTISGANTKADTIELGVKNLGNNKYVCEVVTIDGVPTETKKVEIRQALDGNNFNAEMADMNITIGRPMFKCINTTPKAVLDSKKLVFADGKQITLVKDKEEKAIMRPFKGSNMNGSLAGGNIAEKDKYIVLSTKYAGIYKVNEVLDGVKFKIPDPADIFWNEDNHIKMPELWATIGGIFKKFDIIGWLKDGEGNPVTVGSIMTFLFGESNKDHEIVAKLGAVNLYVNGNGQSDGENYVIEEFNCNTDTLPENTFEKEFLDDYYYIELGEQKRHETKYSYQGWSLSDDATYQSEGVMQPQGKLDYADVLTYIDSHKDSITYGDNGLPNIPLYVVWDKYPEIETKEICFSEMELDQSLNLSDADSVYLDDKGFASVLYERVVGTDDEDGVLTNGAEEKGVICEDSIQDLRAELLSFEHTGATTVTFKAIDGVGNVKERRVRVWINRGNPIEEAYINRARVINRKYYDIGKEYADKLVEDNKNRPENEKIGSYEINVARMLLTGKLDRSDAGDAYIEAHKDENPALYYMTGFNHGGLMPIDMWYTDPEYRKCIEEAFDNRENDTPEYSWKFTHEQVLETQEYVETYGISTSEHQDALWNYFNKYKSSFKKLK